MEKKIIVLKEDFGEYATKDVNDLIFDLFIYSYEGGGYDGTGFALWKRGKEFFYDYLGHCSCNGPTESLDSANRASFTWEQILVLKPDDENMKNVIEEMKKHV